jgi:predicted enzyme related to lactoylglutathione lyase
VGIWIPVTDTARARKFYTTVFGWTCMKTGTPSPIDGIKETYFFTNGGSINGCFCEVEESKIIPSAKIADKTALGVHAVFSVKDIAESLDLVEKIGGHKHVGRTSMGPNMGYIARFLDSEGNLIGLHAMN